MVKLLKSVIPNPLVVSLYHAALPPPYNFPPITYPVTSFRSVSSAGDFHYDSDFEFKLRFLDFLCSISRSKIY
ncbi:hypothetical protein L1987_42496 [Smallanthus sonchifolius]|uniref:Uncharacterized protein n=1 Tax=Smallanthus sonchifolius TaxID=185202 RepID=A0ACB9GK06_9ASTR|nr:hypothetical protein L1987_42496 [Smallanthus sonchifolius]